MIATHEAEVALRFDALRRRFKTSLAGDDYRLRGHPRRLGTGRRPADPRPGLRQGPVLPGTGGQGSPGRRARPLAGHAGRGRRDPPRSRHRPQAPVRAPMLRRDHRRRGLRASGCEGARHGSARRRGGCSGRAGSWRSSTRTSPRCRPSGRGFPASRSSGSTSIAAAGCIPPEDRSASAGSGPGH